MTDAADKTNAEASEPSRDDATGVIESEQVSTGVAKVEVEISLFDESTGLPANRGLTAAGDQATRNSPPDGVVNEEQRIFYDISEIANALNPKQAAQRDDLVLGAECIAPANDNNNGLSWDVRGVTALSQESLDSSKECRVTSNITRDDQSPLPVDEYEIAFEEESNEDDISSEDKDTFDEEATGLSGGDSANACSDPSSLVVIGHRMRLYTPPGMEEANSSGEEDDQEPPTNTEMTSTDEKHEDNSTVGETDTERNSSPTLQHTRSSVPATTTPPQRELKRGQAKRPTLSPVLEADVREYLENWTADDDEEDETGIDSGAGDATIVIADRTAHDGNERDYTAELSAALSSAAVDAAVAEIDSEVQMQASHTATADQVPDPIGAEVALGGDLDESADDVVIILPERFDLNYDNVPNDGGLQYQLQQSVAARNQLEAQADFLENSLNCLEVTLDRMSLNEAVMPDGSVVFLKDQLRKSRSGHLMRAWEKAAGWREDYAALDNPQNAGGENATLDTPLAQLQKNTYQDEIRAFSAANEEMRTAVTQASLQEQALRGQARQMQQNYEEIHQNISRLSHELGEIQNRHHRLQKSLMGERVAKETAQRENECLLRQSDDIFQQTQSVPYGGEDQTVNARQSRRTRERPVSAPDIPTAPRSAPAPQMSGQRWVHPPMDGRRRDREYAPPPPQWRRGFRPPFGPRPPFGQRPWRRNWRWNGRMGGYQRPPGRYWPRNYGPRVERLPPPPRPDPFTPTFKKETEVMLRQFFTQMSCVEDLLRERGFAKGPAAEGPSPYAGLPGRFRSRNESYPAPSFSTRRGLVSRSVPSMTVAPYRDRSKRNTGWFETSRSQTTQGETVHPFPTTSSSAAAAQATVSA